MTDTILIKQFLHMRFFGVPLSESRRLSESTKGVHFAIPPQPLSFIWFSYIGGKEGMKINWRDYFLI